MRQNSGFYNVLTVTSLHKEILINGENQLFVYSLCLNNERFNR